MDDPKRTLDATLQARALEAMRPAAAGDGWPYPRIEALRTRNAILDSIFYDVQVLSPQEGVALAPWLAAEGAIVHVPPSGAGMLSVCASVDEFAARFGAGTRALAVAGVGSSALGAAAFARNVADAIDAPVAAVVSGYGLADVLGEAAGGFFLFGVANAMRHAFEWLERLGDDGRVEDPGSTGGGVVTTPFLRDSKDVLTVEALLTHRELAFGLVVGHSKGNLVISEALFGIGAAAPARLAGIGARLLVVTVSAKIAMPRACRRVVDVLGQLDAFGALNSRPDIATDVVVPGAGHGTNTRGWWPLPVTPTLRAIPALRAWAAAARA